MDNIETVRSKTDIVDLISTYIPLKKAGKNYKAVCPFHTEKTPSFMVSQEIQRYRCFGCGKSGDVFNFVMDMEGLDFSEALRFLADKAGVKLQYQDSHISKEQKSQKDKIINLNKTAQTFYTYMLHSHKVGIKGLNYLKSRNVKPQIIKEFKLGYAPNNWNLLTQYLTKRGFEKEDLINSGLVKLSEKGDLYDMFRGRLMFPLIDHMDRIIGFAGRALNPNQEPKYINTPETLIFHKEQFLYGLNLAKPYIRETNLAIVVEGEFDMITPYQNGIKNICASKGTALTLPQITQLKRYTDNIVIIFDSDKAGLTAAERGASMMQSMEADIKVVLLPEQYKDPDEIAQKDIKKLETLIENAIPIWDFFFYFASQKYDINDIYEKKDAAWYLGNKIAAIKNEVIKAEYVKKYSELFDIDENKALNIIEEDSKNVTHFDEITQKNVIPKSSENILKNYPSHEIYILALLLHISKENRNKYIDQINEEYFIDEQTRELFSTIKKAALETKSLDIKGLYDKLLKDNNRSHNLFESVYLIDLEDKLQSDEALQKELESAIKRLKKVFYEQKIKTYGIALKKAETVSDTREIEMLTRKIKKLTEDLSVLSF